MKKKSLLLAISAMSIAAIGVGTVGTFAWYSASSNASVQAAAGDKYTLSTVKSDVQVAAYTITVTPNVSGSVQLTNAVQETPASTYKLQYGGVTGGKAVVADCASASGFVATVSFTAEWGGIGKPTQAEDIAYFKNKRLTGGTFGVEGQAKLINANAVAGLTVANGTEGTYYIDVSNSDALELTVTVVTNGYVRSQATGTEANGAAASAEADHTGDKVVANAVNPLAVGAKA